MEEQKISDYTAKLATELNLDLKIYGKGYKYTENGNEYWTSIKGGTDGDKKTKRVIVCTQSLLQKYLRDKHDIKLCVSWTKNNNWLFEINHFHTSVGGYNSYEQCLEDGLQEALKLIR